MMLRSCLLLLFVAAPAGMPAGEGPAAPGASPGLSDFIRACRDAIKPYWAPSLVLIRMHPEYVAQVTVAVQADGLLGEPRISSSSGDPIFDEAALRAVRQARRCPPPPEAWRSFAANGLVLDLRAVDADPWSPRGGAAPPMTYSIDDYGPTSFPTLGSTPQSANSKRGLGESTEERRPSRFTSGSSPLSSAEEEGMVFIGAGEAPRSPGLPAISARVFPSESPELFAFSQSVRAAILARWSPPPQLIREHPDYAVLVSIKLQADGTLSAPRVFKTSGDESFDQSVILAVIQTGRIPPPPEVWTSVEGSYLVLEVRARDK